MTSTSIRFSISDIEDEDFTGSIAANHTAILSDSWADCEDNAESAVSDICEDFFGESEWTEILGDESTLANVLVEIHSPASIAGKYEVYLSRPVKASAHKMVVK